MAGFAVHNAPLKMERYSPSLKIKAEN